MIIRNAILAATLMAATLTVTAQHASAASFTAVTKPKGAKTCTNTHNPDGTRCTTCTYSAINETTVHCIRIKPRSSKRNQSIIKSN